MDEAACVHRDAWRRGCRVAARGARAAAHPGCADRLRVWDRERRRPRAFRRSIAARNARAGLRRWEGFHRRISRRRGRQARVPELVAELVQAKVDVLVTPIPTAIRAAKQATDTIPIVMVTSIDPVATGIIDSLAKPGGNITGLFTLTQDLSAKRLEFLKDMVPKLARVGILVDAGEPVAATGYRDFMRRPHGHPHAARPRSAWTIQISKHAPMGFFIGAAGTSETPLALRCGCPYNASECGALDRSATPPAYAVKCEPLVAL